MPPPAVAIVHYHLRRGGVTRVIETASASLTRLRIPHIILSGTLPESGKPLPVRVIEGLDYRPDAPEPPANFNLVHALRQAANEELGLGRYVWHFHNHSIGKSRPLTDAVAQLAESGDPMILQYHDFAEDGRPANYPVIASSETLYPFAPQIVHAFINSRNRRQLMAAGLPEEQTGILPNAVTPPARRSTTKPSTHPLVLYPVRGIRRKNLGELFLLASLAPKGTRFATSLAPANPRWNPYHDEWLAFAEDSKLPVILDAVHKVSPAPRAKRDFASWIRHSTHFVTTSVAEGFGLGFLEPATIDKPLLGRRIPMLTEDFATAGIQPGRLYDHLLVPHEWVGLETLRQRLIRSMQSMLERYGLQMSNAQLERSFAAMRHGKHLDFGNLPEDLQRQVIHRLLAGTGHDEVLASTQAGTQALREWLATTLKQTTPTVTPDQLTPYLPPAYGKRLTELLEHITTATPEAPRYLAKHKVLAEFVKPGCFHFLCS